MARKKKSELEAEAATAATPDTSERGDEVVATTNIDETAGAELVDPAPMQPAKSKPLASPRPTPAELAATEPKRYEVVRGGRIMHRGALTLMRTGKVFKANVYNVDQLRQQGIELKEV